MIKYTVLPEQKKVIAIVTDCEDDVIKTIAKNMPENLYFNEGAYKLKHSYKGIAKCHPDDEFDEDLGKKIARNRALIKYKFAYLRKIDLFSMGLLKWILDTGEKGDTCAQYIESLALELKDKTKTE